MREIPLTQGRVALVDDADYEWLSAYRWHAHLSNKNWYARRKEVRDGKVVRVYMHRHIAGTPSGLQTDHIDGNSLNNCRANLRSATNSQNGMNKGKIVRARASKYKGVNRHRSGWQAAIQINGVCFCSKTLTDEAEAARAYDELARKHHGDFARLNFPA